MKVTYIGHSGFQTDWEDMTWVFDYEKGDLEEPEAGRPRIFFVSHKHQDHFNPEILRTDRDMDWYVLDRGVRKQVEKMGLSESVLSRIIFVKADQELKLWDFEPQIKVRTLHSTDCGVAYLVNYKEKSIYHAGDLNWWVWEGEPKQESNNMTAKFKREIEKLKGIKVDLAFLPLDQRQENWSCKGMEYFLENIGADHVFPMHFWGDFAEERRMIDSKELEPYRSSIALIEKTGEEFIIK
ncbi:MAG: MBL fold metallo-hydrolase [Clostridia bacterium]|nr:MBL fold metallo-hydrolase [Clostridia bacterium]NCC44610.1 MBL fold metallo-hydrolase [Clostridia bacterium]